MGSEEGGSNEQPVHEVYLDAFWMDAHEVTNAQFSEFLNIRGNSPEGGTNWLDASDNDVLIEKNGSNWQPVSGFEDHPVTYVNWYGAQSYCEWAGRRLSTEAEWEKAARGGLEGKKYPWGDKYPDCYQGAENGAQIYFCDGRTVPVRSFSPNGYGLYDMAGNALEWVSDYYENSPVENPQGTASGKPRVLRGGSWSFNADFVRTAFRLRGNPISTYSDVGFRCAASQD